MEDKTRYTLQRTMLVYFLLIGFASLFVSIEFIADTNSPELRQELINNFTQYSQNEIKINDVFLPIEKIRNKAILMIAIIMLVMAIVLTMFTKNITEPLQHMLERAKKISAGDLRQSIEIHSNNELAELGNMINELASNLQETTLLSKNVCLIGSNSISSTLALLDKDNLDSGDRDQIRQQLDRLKREMGSLEGLVNCFHFYKSDHGN
ncbi:MAG: HAMP domain-containing protein [Thermodesulfobacteriota bacterium]